MLAVGGPLVGFSAQIVVGSIDSIKVKNEWQPELGLGPRDICIFEKMWLKSFPPMLVYQWLYQSEGRWFVFFSRIVGTANSYLCFG